MLDKIMGFFKGNKTSGAGQHQSNAKADAAKEELMANAQKALRMKQESGGGANIPPHQTAREGMQVNETQEDHIPAKEGNFQPELKRSKVARSGDAS